MLKNRVWVVNSLICMIVLYMGCWHTRSEAYEPWKGRIAERVNVRKAPKEGNNIITQIDKGIEVTISDEKDGWYKVIVEEDTFGFIGWVFGKYIDDPNAFSPARSSLPKDQGKGREEVSAPSLPADSYDAMRTGVPGSERESGARSGRDLEKSAIADSKVSERIVERQIVSEPPTAKDKTGFQDQVERELAIHEMAETPEIGKGMEGGQSPLDMMTRGKASRELGELHVARPEPSLSAVPLTRAAPLEIETPLPLKELNKPVEKDDPVTASSQEKSIAETERTEGHDSKRNPGWASVMGVVVKLVGVAFSCIALIFAYRACLITSALNKE